MSIRASALATLGVIALSVFLLAASTRAHALDSGEGAARNIAGFLKGASVPVAVVALEADTDGDTIPDSTDPTPDHDVAVFNLYVIGPSVINLSDTTGTYMWVSATLFNLRDHNE